jgi:hypothetical protein
VTLAAHDINQNERAAGLESATTAIGLQNMKPVLMNFDL